MALGLCCQFVETITKRNSNIEYKNLLDERHLQFGKFNKGDYSEAQIKAAWLSNVQNLLVILKRIQRIGYKSFRVSSGLIPLYDLVPDLLNADDQVQDS